MINIKIHLNENKKAGNPSCVNYKKVATIIKALFCRRLFLKFENSIEISIIICYNLYKIKNK